MNDLIAALPTERSSEAQTTIRSARSPEVTKIFSPLRTYSSPSSSAVVRIAAESEPASGSVIAIAAHLPPYCSSCSSVATEAIAELPSPWRGIVSSRPTSPQQSSMMPSTVERLVPLRFSPSSVVARVAADAGGAGGAVLGGVVHPVDQRGEHVELFRVGVLGLVVLAGDRPEDLGRDLVGLARRGA